MGTTHYAFVGPYLKCRRPVREKVIETRHRGCVNTGCPKHRHEFGGMTAKFCPQCGKELGVFTTSKTVDGSNVDLCELFDGKEPFSSVFGECGPKSMDPFDILVPTYRPGYDPDCEDEATRRQFRVTPREGSTYQELSSLSPGDETAWLMEKYAAEIEKVRRAYGENAVKVCWGFLTWGN